ncbi:hypothetical protein LZZ85_00680 [Terrimonas sp. NA20]|uniref:Glycoside hydrolase n=1 Tax=Terrimonas ginsenosidimutans TaxID=2908004 RepID=A0ABS9KKG9_9BACT|nr:GH25 family lysozyme [Terrimonas ginsenosidimutans]MCG2612765.1 hypothetical protein [Terrimonas ginsenosidimutans]
MKSHKQNVRTRGKHFVGSVLTLLILCLPKAFWGQETENQEFYMGASIRSDSTQSIGKLNLLRNDTVKQSFYNYTGVRLKDDVKYGKYGVDISKWNGVIDWNKVQTDTVPDRIQFVIAKATQGRTLVDARFKENFSAAKAKGFLTGAYHFYDQKAEPAKQAENFINTVKLEKGDLMPILDVERNCFADCDKTPDLLIPKNELIKNLKAFIGLLKEHYKTDVIIYTGEAFYNAFLADDFKDNYFWIAKYSYTPPRCFQVGETFSLDNPCFKNSKKGCWQYTQWGNVKGFDSNVDLNFINNYYLLKWIIK